MCFDRRRLCAKAAVVMVLWVLSREMLICFETFRMKTFLAFVPSNFILFARQFLLVIFDLLCKRKRHGLFLLFSPFH